jgi:uncharacterized membrane protein YgcG
MFKDGETVSEFGVRISALAENLRTYGDYITDSEVVKKMLQVVPRNLTQAAVSIEMFMDLNKASIVDVVGQLRIFEERDKAPQVTDAMGRLMLCEEDWEACRKARHEQEGSGSGGGSSNRAKRGGRGHGRGGSSSSSRDSQGGESAARTAARRATGPKIAAGRRRAQRTSHRPRRTSTH